MRSTPGSSSLSTTGRFLVAALLAMAAGCATDVEEDEMSSGEDALVEGEGAGVIYFHGMSGLGFGRSALTSTTSRPLLAPGMTDAQIQAPIAPAVLSFLDSHPDGVVGGYSLGRIPVFRLMKASAEGMNRVVMIDPTFDSASVLSGEKGIGGAIARTWLDGSDERSFMLVYGDVTKELGGERSYEAALKEHPRAELCFVRGAHDRFRARDMAYALIAKSCADLREHLGR